MQENISLKTKKLGDPELFVGLIFLGLCLMVFIGFLPLGMLGCCKKEPSRFLQ